MEFTNSDIHEDHGPYDVIDEMAQLLADSEFGSDTMIRRICYGTAVTAAIEDGLASDDHEAFEVVGQRIEAFKRARDNGEG